MGPNYRIANLVNGVWEWLSFNGGIYITCDEKQAKCMEEIYKNKYQTQIVKAFGADHKLPLNPTYSARIFEDGTCLDVSCLTHEQTKELQAFIGKLLTQGDK